MTSSLLSFPAPTPQNPSHQASSWKPKVRRAGRTWPRNRRATTAPSGLGPYTVCRTMVLKEPVYDGNAYSFTTTYHDGQMQLYATHPIAPTTAGEPPEYHMTILNSYAMTGNPRNFREGATAYRNVRDMTKKVRESFIKQANKVAAGIPAETLSTNRHSNHTPELAAPELDSDSSLDEVALDVAIKAKRSRRDLASHDDDDDGTRMSFMKPEADACRARRYIPGGGNQTRNPFS